MPAHIPFILGAGLTLGVATAVYVNREKIKEIYLEKKRELEHELAAIQAEVRNTFHPETEVEMQDRFTSAPSSSASSANPFSDSNAIGSSTETITNQDDDLYHSFESTKGLRSRKHASTNAAPSSVDEYTDEENLQSDADERFFSFVEPSQASEGATESWTESDGEWTGSNSGFNTPTASEAGDYYQARQFG